MKPKLPGHFLVQDRGATVRMIAGRVVSFALAAGVIAGVTDAALPLAVKIVVILLAGAVGGVAMQNLGLVGHEGTHFSLHPKRLTSARIGVLVSSLVPLHLDAGFATSHALHHRHTNTERDPDVEVFGRYRTFLSRLLLARIAATLAYFKETWRLAFAAETGGEPPLALTRAELRGLARLNLAASGLVTAVYATLAVLFGLPALLAVLVPWGAALLLSSLRPYLEHAGTDGDRATNARSWISPLYDWTFGGINYHHAHHLYPSVPSYRIKELHQWLVASGAIELGRAEVITTLREGVDVVSGRTQYGRRWG